MERTRWGGAGRGPVSARAATWIIAAGTVLFALAALPDGGWPQLLFAHPPHGGLGVAASTSLLFLFLFAAVALGDLTWLGWGIAIFWLTNLIAAASLDPLPAHLSGWTGFVEAAALAASGVIIASGRLPALGGIRASTIGLSAAMLLLFAAIHLGAPAAIAALEPAGLPARAIWPYLSGAFQALAALALLVARFRAMAAAIVAALFASWLPIVHLARIAAAPTDPFELQFAAMALCLAGHFLLLAVPDASLRTALRAMTCQVG